MPTYNCKNCHMDNSDWCPYCSKYAHMPPTVLPPKEELIGNKFSDLSENIHTKTKHRSIGFYLRLWYNVFNQPKFSSLTKYFIDLCSFRGIYVCKNKLGKEYKYYTGSALVGYKYPNLNIITTDKEQKYVNELSRYPEYFDTSNRKIEHKQGDFNQVIDGILEEIPKKSASLILIDPYGYDAIQYESLLKISEQETVDLIISVMIDNIYRQASSNNPLFKSALTRFFGTEDYTGYSQDKNLLFAYYVKRLNGLGFKHYYPFRLLYETQDRNLYYLTLFSKNPKAEELYQKCGEYVLKDYMIDRKYDHGAQQTLEPIELKESIFDPAKFKKSIDDLISTIQ